MGRVWSPPVRFRPGRRKGWTTARGRETASGVERFALNRPRVPGTEEAADYYEAFGLTPTLHQPGRHVFATADGGEQLTLIYSPRRRLVEIALTADHAEDLDRVARSLDGLMVHYKRDSGALRTRDPHSGLKVRIEIGDPVRQSPTPQELTNGPVRPHRANGRAGGIERNKRSTLGPWGTWSSGRRTRRHRSCAQAVLPNSSRESSFVSLRLNVDNVQVKLLQRDGKNNCSHTHVRTALG